MDIKLAKVIENLGLEQKEARVYLAALELGGGSILEIARKANVERVNTYYVVEAMMSKGVIFESKRGKSKKFFAITPAKLEQMIEARMADLRRIMPELVSIENSRETKPRIRFYEGMEGIKQVYNETLEVERGGEILSIAPATEIYAYMDADWIPYYLEKRAKKGITMRAIAEDSELARKHQANDKQELRETRLVPVDKFYFKNEINIFNNKVMMASYRDQMGVIIESHDVADTQRAFFELAWVGADAYRRKGKGRSL